MKKGIVMAVSVLLVVALFGAAIELKKVFTKEAVQMTIKQLDWWGQIEYQDTKGPLRATAGTLSHQIGGDYWDARELLREYFSAPGKLWDSYQLLKPHIVNELKKEGNEKLREKFLSAYTSDFLNHLEGKSPHKEYLAHRWNLSKELDTFWSAGMTDTPEYKEKEAAFLAFQEKSGITGYKWGYPEEISYDNSFAFDFYMRRKSEGGERVAAMYAAIARDLLAAIK